MNLIQYKSVDDESLKMYSNWANASICIVVCVLVYQLGSSKWYQVIWSHSVISTFQ